MNPVDAKAIRLVEEERVTITWSTGIEAGQGVVDGDTNTYQASYSPAGYVCTCKAGQNHKTCSHAIAVELAVLYDKERNDRLQRAF